MTKKIYAVSLLVVLLIAFSIQVSAANEHVFDKANILTNNEIQLLENKANNIAKNSGADFYIVTVDEYYYEGETFLGSQNLSNQDDIILLVINSYDKPVIYYDIYTYGSANSQITDKEIKYLVHHKEVYDNLKGNNIYEGADAFLSYAEEAYMSKLKPTPEAVSKTIWISVAIGAGVALITVCTVIFLYKRKLKSAKYPLDKYAKLDLTGQSDLFVGSSVTKSRINDSSSSGGGGGGSGHGGGGGHRGGA